MLTDLTNRKLRIWSRDPLDQSYSRNMDFEPNIRVPLLLNSVNIDGMLVKFLLKDDVDHRISSETFVYRPNRPFLFPLNGSLSARAWAVPLLQFLGAMYVAYKLIFNEPNWPDMRQDCGPIDF